MIAIFKNNNDNGPQADFSSEYSNSGHPNI